jgi:hypothetical protein
VSWQATAAGVSITDTATADRIYVVARDAGERDRIDSRRRAALAVEAEGRAREPAQ